MRKIPIGTFPYHQRPWQTPLVDSAGELALREMIFEHLRRAVAQKDVLTREELAAFPVGNGTRRLIDQNRGIWNPQDLQATLSIVSNPDSQYDDEEVGDSQFAYSYRAGSTAGDNTKLRRAIELELPVILFRRIRPAIYVPVFPVYVMADEPEHRRFILAIDELRHIENPRALKPLEREYAKRITNQRLHQPEFRARVLLAYDYRCAVCNIGHRSLVDAAHIIADGKLHGIPEVTNGLALCKLHHAAYDANLLGITPEYEIRISDKLMRDLRGGRMLEYGLQAMNGEPLTLPRSKKEYPSPERLKERFTVFQADNQESIRY